MKLTKLVKYPQDHLNWAHFSNPRMPQKGTDTEMNTKKGLKIGIGLGVGVGIVGLVFCLVHYQHSEKSNQAPSKVPSLNKPLDAAAVAPSVHGEFLKSGVINEKNNGNAKAQSSSDESSKKIAPQQDTECEISQAEVKPIKDEFMDGVLADVEDDSGIAWGAAGKDDDANEAAAFEKQAKVFRTIASELSGNESEKPKAKVVGKLGKHCIAKK